MAVLSVAVSLLPASASEPDGTLDVVPALDRAEAELLDRTLRAAALGVSLQDVVSGDEYEAAFVALASNVETIAPDVFAGAHLGALPADPGTLVFVGEPPADAKAAVADSGLHVIVRTDAKHSLGQLVALSEAVMDVIMNQHPTRDSGVGVDVVENRVFVHADHGLDVQRLVSELVTIGVAEPEDVQVELGTSSLFHGQGGLNIYSRNAKCTTGFAVRSTSSSETGVTTASHCEGMSTVVDRNGDVFGTGFRSEHVGDFGEVEWHTTTHDEFPQAWGDIRTTLINVYGVMARKEITRNSSICSFSEATKTPRRCLPVYTNEYSQYISSHPACRCGVRIRNLVLMDGNFHSFGDSGGPWMRGGTAFGTVVGGYIRSDHRRFHFFSAASAFPSAIGARVLTK